MTFLLAFAAVAGNCKLWSEFANRTHALAWPCRRLRRVRWLHDIGLIGFPFLLTWALWQCDWSIAELMSRSIASWFVLAGCAVGVAWLVFDSMRYLFRGLPRGAEQLSSKFYDVADESEAVPIGDGSRSYWSKLPWNELFQIEVNHKRLTVPEYPADAPPLRILHLTDWHFSGTPGRAFYDYATNLAADLEFDVVVFTGDLIDRMALTEWIEPTLGRLNAPLGQFFILGNHDWFVEHEEIRNVVVAAHWTSVAGDVAVVEHAGMKIAIAGNERPWLGEAPDLVATDADFRIALIHTPDLFGWARGQDANLVLAGHNHGGQVVLPVVGPVYSPSRHGVRYAGGLYRRGETLMHVGRGLGGIHPVRWRCCPEMTVVEIVGSGTADSDATEIVTNSQKSG